MSDDARTLDAELADLSRAIELISGVVTRHPHEVGAPLLVVVERTIHDVEVVMRYVRYELDPNTRRGGR